MKHKKEVLEYVERVISGETLTNKETIQCAKRFKKNYESNEYEFNSKEADFVIGIIEKTFVHDKGEKLDGTPLRGSPFFLEDRKSVV